ncbi:MAG: hypothetical protein ACJAX5_002094 [Patiriisocius sp.]|jgi:hypothetical protein
MAKDLDSVYQQSPQPKSPQPKSHQQEKAEYGQIPLLDDVVFNTELPFLKAKPRATDLFGGSLQTAQSGPLPNHYDAVENDKTSQRVKERTDRVVERLRNELTAVLEDLRPELQEELQKEQQEKPDQT